MEKEKNNPQKFTSLGFDSTLNRRKFLKSSALGVTSLTALNNLPLGAMGLFQQDSDVLYSINPLFRKKLKIQFVIGGVIHESNAPGPCRSGQRSWLTTEVETNMHLQNFEARKKQIREWSFTEEAEILNPVDFKTIVKEKNIEFVFSESSFAVIDRKISEIDLFIVLDGLCGDICVKLAQRYNKPVSTIVQSEKHNSNNTYGGWLVDMPAATRQLGLESYLALDWDDMNRIISLLWVKKAFSHTKLLIFTDRFGKAPYGLESVMYDLDGLKNMYGMNYHQESNLTLGLEIERIRSNKSELSEARQITDFLKSNASEVHMSEDHLMDSVIAYKAVENLLVRNECNAFTIECREICPQELADKYKFTPCLIHSLLKDNGYPSVCQIDINTLLAMMAFMYISKKSVYMGNPAYDVKNNLLTILHDVPGLKMKGFNHDLLPYEIRNFVAEGWGATLRYDFTRDKGTVVTIGRFNALGTAMFLTKGEIMNGFGMNKNSCSLGVEIKVNNVRDIFEKLKDFGSHLAMVYGDYTQEISDLGEVLGFKVIEA